MTLQTLSSAVTRLLQPRGFVRHGKRWLHRSDDLTEVVELLRSKSEDRFLAELGVFDPSVYLQVWPIHPKTITIADCVVRVRLNELGALEQVWFEQRPRDIDTVLDLLRERSPAWFELMHSIDERVRFLRERPYALVPSESVLLALSELATGDETTGRERLLKLQGTVVGPWKDTIRGLLERVEVDAQ